MNDHRIIRQLIARVRDLKGIVAEQDHDYEDCTASAHESAARAHHDYRQQIERMEGLAEENRMAALRRQSERDQAVRDLKRARDWGDSHGIDGAIRRLK